MINNELSETEHKKIMQAGMTSCKEPEITDDIRKTIAKVTGDKDYDKASLLAELYVRERYPDKAANIEKTGFVAYVLQEIPATLILNLTASQAVISYCRDAIK